MKIVFLDFDGVLNSEKYLRASDLTGVAINKEKLLLLKRVIDETGAKIVLTTSWRSHWDKEVCDETGIIINKLFFSVGLEIFDKTPEPSLRREEEIKAWLNSHSDIENFVVLDDMMLGGKFLENHFVKTCAYRDGLSEEDAKNAIKILKG